MNIAVLMTCHNRSEKTLRCLDSLFAQELPADEGLIVWLVDDASTDGTAEAVLARFPAVQLVAGDGNLFWCGGMTMAWKHAAETSPDVFLWLNDDVVLGSGAIAALHAVAAEHPGSIVVGSCACPISGYRTYGGLRRAGAHPGKIRPIEPRAQPVRCDTFEGNIVWVPASAFAVLGPLRGFRHAMGDVDYGYRAARAGIPAWIAPGFPGSCAGNSKNGTWEDTALGFGTRWKKLGGIKGLPATDWWEFCRSHGGWKAPLYFVGPYLRIALGR